MTATKTRPTLLTCADTAERLGVSTSTLADWRLKGTGPEFVRLGDGPRAHIRYRLDVLDAWLDARTVKPRDAR
ncbi:helix-turn-helix transcriptional regulator [Cellulosimicrobium protaetiae]